VNETFLVLEEKKKNVFWTQRSMFGFGSLPFFSFIFHHPPLFIFTFWALHDNEELNPFSWGKM